VLPLRWRLAKFVLFILVDFRMLASGTTYPLSLAIRRRLASTGRAALRALAMIVALASSGMAPTALCGGSNEAESSQQEGEASQYAAVHCEARARLRRLAHHRLEVYERVSHAPTTAGQSARQSPASLSTAQLSLGLMLPLRC
jgi:hypothetical protein